MHGITPFHVKGLAPPPREVPPGLRLKVLDHRDMGWAAAFFIVATLLLLVSLTAPPKPRFAVVVVASIFVILGGACALNVLLGAKEALRLMREGILTPGRIVACRWAWDRKHREQPYARFLSNWASELARSQMRKGWGCFGMFALVFFGLPFMLITLAFAIGLGLNALGYGEETSSENLWAGVQFVASMALTLALGFALFRFIGGTGIDKGLIPLMKAEQVLGEIEGRDYEALVGRLKALFEGTPQDDPFDQPLPADANGIQLLCRVQFALGGELRTAEGRVHFNNRLQGDGVEPLLLDPRHPGKIQMLAGLPDAVGVNPMTRRWEEVDAGAAKLRLAMAALFGVVSLAGCSWYFFR